jgi:hypothetical protein
MGGGQGAVENPVLLLRAGLLVSLSCLWCVVYSEFEVSGVRQMGVSPVSASVANRRWWMSRCTLLFLCGMLLGEGVQTTPAATWVAPTVLAGLAALLAFVMLDLCGTRGRQERMLRRIQRSVRRLHSRVDEHIRPLAHHPGARFRRGDRDIPLRIASGLTDS